MADKGIDVWPTGTRIIFLDAQIGGIITQLRIQEKYVDYNIAYWHNGDRKTAWCEAKEFTVKNGEKVRVGFRSP